MAAKKKTYKRMTVAEKEQNKRVKKEMVKLGMIGPPKKRLNRKKFIEDVERDIKELHFGASLSDAGHLEEAIRWMKPSGVFRITDEEIGVMKVIRMAIDIKRFKDGKKSEGQTSYSIGEIYEEVIKPVKEL